MLKTFKTIQAQDREKFVAPESVQDVIPVKRIWDDGIFLVGTAFSLSARTSTARCSVLTT